MTLLNNQSLNQRSQTVKLTGTIRIALSGLSSVRNFKYKILRNYEV